MEDVDIGYTDVAQGEFGPDVGVLGIGLGRIAQSGARIKLAVRPGECEPECLAPIADRLRVEELEQSGVQVRVDLVELVLDARLRRQKRGVGAVVDLLEILLDLRQVRPILCVRRRRDAGQSQTKRYGKTREARILRPLRRGIHVAGIFVKYLHSTLSCAFLVPSLY